MGGLGLDACVPEEVDLQRWHLRGLAGASFPAWRCMSKIAGFDLFGKRGKSFRGAEELRLEESERLREKEQAENARREAELKAGS